MKQIKLKIVDWWGGDFDDNFVVKLLREKFEVVESSNPDYLLYSVFGCEHINYDCVRILFIGENIIPNFNVCDYAIGVNYITFEDRYLYYPLFLLYQKDLDRALQKHKIQDISHKNKFCNYIFSNTQAAKIRGDFFDFLSKYKKIDSAGVDRNNINIALPREGDTKYEFMKDYKFSIAFENSSTNGYCTEKILQAFAAATIPIYWGDKEICKKGGFNEKSFININDYDNFENALEAIKKLDNDKQAYLAMLREKVFKDDNYIEQKNKELENFLDNIFNQEPNKAFRRKNEFYYKFFNDDYNRQIRISNCIITINKIIKKPINFAKKMIFSNKNHS